MRTDDMGVWITGVGLATPMGSTFRDFADQLMAGKSAIRRTTAFDVTDHACKIGGYLDALACPQQWDPADFQACDPSQQLQLACAIEALVDAGWWSRRSDLRIGVLLGCGAEWLITWETDMHQAGNRVREPQADGSGLTRWLQQKLHLCGPVATVSAACAGGNIALGMARQWIRRGIADIVLTGAAERAITPMSVACFGNLGALSTRNDRPAAASRPFDRDRDGFVMSEGGALFVLESSGIARRRGARCYGQVVGFGCASDAFHIVAPSEDPRHAAHAIRLALQDAQLDPSAIDYVNAHATSTPVGDVFETRALQEALGAHAATTPVSGTKSMTGHMIGAASAVEAAICLAAFDRQALPPTINLENLDPQCPLHHIANQTRERHVSTAISNSFGFGGNNTCLVLRRAA